jgi:ABC-2 type transport system permease protein
VTNAKTQRYKYSVILLGQLVKTEFRLRYQGSFLGYLWSLLRPLALFGILYFVFAKLIGLGVGIDNYGVYLLLGVVVWSFFSEVTSASITSVVARGDLLRKINFPKYVIVLSTMFSSLINFGLNMIVVLGFAIVFGVQFTPKILWMIPLFLELMVLSLGLSFFMSAIFVKFRDINFIWEVTMQGAFYATPILYPLSIVPESAAKILMLNPMAQIIQDMRYVFVSTQTETISTIFGNPAVRLIPITLCILLFIFSIFFFKKRAKHFAEQV